MTSPNFKDATLSYCILSHDPLIASFPLAQKCLARSGEDLVPEALCGLRVRTMPLLMKCGQILCQVVVLIHSFNHSYHITWPTLCFYLKINWFFRIVENQNIQNRFMLNLMRVDLFHVEHYLSFEWNHW